MAELLKQLETKLNSMNDIEASFNNLVELMKANEKETETIKNAIDGMTEREKEVIQRICINGERLESIGKDFNKTPRQISNWKNNALKSLYRRLYGTEL
jgi:DNA-directed RNA polymerase specialized sigma subunit